MRKSALLSVGILVLLAGCPNWNLRHVGSLVLKFSTAELPARTIIPNLDMEVASYDISGIGPDSATFRMTGVTGSSAAQNSLVIGAWMITVEAYNDDDILIGSGSAAIEIRAGKTTTETIEINPLNGKGTFTVNISWTPDLIADPSAVATLSAAGGSTQDLTFVPGDDSLSYTSGNTLDMGYYLFQLVLKDGGNPTWGCTESIRILKDQTTSAVFQLTENDINTGGLSMTVVPNLQNPITIDFSGQAAFLPTGTDMTVTASTSVSGVACQWYLNGQILPGETQSYITSNCSAPFPQNTGHMLGIPETERI